ncbi:hypothetical protein [Fusibacter sp. JL216-2]|uniref:hypothetical protein n=1 Tax=Fusibacter sp. JL216-2 TaxID=3071453 RepID=UPI003D331765
MRSVLFALLFSASFLPNLMIIDSFIKFDVSMYRKVLASLMMGSIFLFISKALPVSNPRLLLQACMYFIVLYVVMKMGWKKTLKATTMLMLISLITESFVLKMLETTLMGYEQLFMIDTFYALTLLLYDTILFAVAFIVRQITKHREFQLKMKDVQVRE